MHCLHKWWMQTVLWMCCRCWDYGNLFSQFVSYWKLFQAPKCCSFIILRRKQLPRWTYPQQLDKIITGWLTHWLQDELHTHSYHNYGLLTAHVGRTPPSIEHPTGWWLKVACKWFWAVPSETTSPIIAQLHNITCPLYLNSSHVQ